MAEFFIEDLVDSLLGAPDVTARAQRFLSPEVLAHADEVRAAFEAGGRVKHVCLDRALRPQVARGIGRALANARFRRHHHAPYRIDVAPLATLGDDVLGEFCAWLGSPDAAAFHAWLVDWPRKTKGSLSWQVQVARAKRGDEFPPHIDTNDEGLACVYNFTRGFGASDGGVLDFPRGGVVVPPVFNRLMVFRPRGAEHGVSRVTAPRGRHRYTVTVFYLWT